METVRVISTSTIQAPSQNNIDSTHQKIDLTPWDLRFLPIGSIQKGLLYGKSKDTSIQIQQLKHSFSTTLSFFTPLAGRLVILQHEDSNTASSHILCNNAGALFVHAVAENTTVADILEPNYVPLTVHSFFPLNGIKNYQGTSEPLLGVQITELVDGIFMGCTLNHVAADGKSFWHFINSWSEITRGLDKVTKPPSLERWFYDGVDRPVHFPFKEEQHHENLESQSSPPPERIFHFTKEKIAQLKSKANADVSTNKISSLQALLTHLWCSVIRAKRLDPQEDVHYLLQIGLRPRVVPPLPEDYLGNSAIFGGVTMKAGELLEGGLGKGALEMNKMIASYSHEKVKSDYESWVRTPRLLSLNKITSNNSLGTSSSPRFNFYGNDFGWGKPVAVRSGAANKSGGKITVYGGAEEGSIDIELCLPYETLEALGNDPEFVDVISN